MSRSFPILAAIAVLASVPAAAVAQERASPPRPPNGSQPPPGSYLSTCRGANMNGNMLSAQCPGPTGAPIFSSIDTNGCRGRDIANDRGYLRCNGNGNGGGPRPPKPPRPEPPQPPSPGHGQAIAYTRPNFQGKQLHIRMPIANLANYSGFNDHIRSIRLVRGQLRVCTESLFRGRCAVIHRSYRDLGVIGMSNSISSIH